MTFNTVILNIEPYVNQLQKNICMADILQGWEDHEDGVFHTSFIAHDGQQYHIVMNSYDLSCAHFGEYLTGSFKKFILDGPSIRNNYIDQFQGKILYYSG